MWVHVNGCVCVCVCISVKIWLVYSGECQSSVFSRSIRLNWQHSAKRKLQTTNQAMWRYCRLTTTQVHQPLLILHSLSFKFRGFAFFFFLLLHAWAEKFLNFVFVCCFGDPWIVHRLLNILKERALSRSNLLYKVVACCVSQLSPVSLHSCRLGWGSV